MREAGRGVPGKPGEGPGGAPGSTEARRRTPDTGRGPMVTWADRIVLYVLLGLGIVLLAATGSGGEGGRVRIEGDATEEVASLREHGTFEVDGPLGTTVVVVEDGSARIVSSPCPHGTCVRMGEVRGAGEAVVCVPNRVVVAIEGGADAATDAVTR